jgi:hypothetical protein
MSQILITVTKDDRALARRVHSVFAAKPGAKHIASEFALAHLAAVLRQHSIHSVLEFGSGIGTITYLLLNTLPPTARVVCAERDEWCRSQFANNIPADLQSRITLFPESRPKISGTFDLIVIDGPTGVCGVRDGSIIFAEGGRTTDRMTLQKYAVTLGLTCEFTHYPQPGYRIRWRMSRLGISLPRIRPRKGCWIGIARAAPTARSDEASAAASAAE